MGQAEIMEFLMEYRKSSKYKIKKWLTAREIHKGLRKKINIQISSVTASLRRLRESGIILHKELPKYGKLVLHYQAK